MKAHTNPLAQIREIINNQKLTNKAKFQEILNFIETFEDSEAEQEYFFTLGYKMPKALRNAVAKLETRSQVDNYVYFLASTRGYELSQTDIIIMIQQNFGDVDINALPNIIARAKVFKGKVKHDN